MWHPYSMHAFFHQMVLLCLVLFFAALQSVLHFNLSAQLLFFLTITLTIGVFHGLLDIILLNEKPFNKRQFLLLYSLIAVASLVFFAGFSGSALAVLLLLSVWHFGEAQRFDDALHHHQQLLYLKRFIQGGSALAAPFIVANQQLQQVLGLLMLQAPWLQITWFVWNAIAWIWLFCFFIYLTVLTAKNSLNSFYAGLLEIMVVWLSFALLPPLVAFSLYFGCYHAVRHIRDVLSETNAIKSNAKQLANVAILTASLFISVIVLLNNQPFHQFLQKSLQTISLKLMLTATLVLLVAITLPHALLISFWRKTKRDKSL